MAQKYLQPGETWDTVTPAGGWTSDQVVKVGSMVGVALLTTAAGVTNQVRLAGVFRDQPKATGENWSAGDKLYWDDTAKKFTKTATNNTAAAYAWYGAASADTTGYIKLAQVA